MADALVNFFSNSKHRVTGRPFVPSPFQKLLFSYFTNSDLNTLFVTYRRNGVTTALSAYSHYYALNNSNTNTLVVGNNLTQVAHAFDLVSFPNYVKESNLLYTKYWNNSSVQFTTTNQVSNVLKAGKNYDLVLCDNALPMTNLSCRYIPKQAYCMTVDEDKFWFSIKDLPRGDYKLVIL